MSNQLEKELEYYLKHQNELVRKHNGRFVVIKGRKILGVYDSELQAIGETTSVHKLGTFLVRRCEPESEKQVHTYYSRAVL